MSRLVPITCLFILMAVPSSAQTIRDRLIQQEELTNADLVAFGAFDTIHCWHQDTRASVDTTVMLSDALWASVLLIGDSMGVCAFTFLMTYDVGALHVVALKEVHPDCDIDMSMPEPRYYVHKFVTASIIDVAEVRPNEHNLGDTIYTDPPDLMALRRVQIQPNGFLLDTGFQSLQEWTGPVRSIAEIEEWGY